MAVNTVWGPHFATGIEIINQQHQRIFSYLKEVDTAVRDRNEAKVQEIARALIDYAVSHNRFEETLMENAGYPLLPAHRKVQSRQRRIQGVLERSRKVGVVRRALGSKARKHSGQKWGLDQFQPPLAGSHRALSIRIVQTFP